MSLQPTGVFRWTQAPWGRVLECGPLGALVRHFFTTRDLPPGSCGTDVAWLDAVAAHAGVGPGRLVRVRQVHGAGVLVVRRGEWRPDAGGPAPAADIIVSDDPAVALAVAVADCVPLLVADRRLGVAAAGHAGWRGTAAGVARALVGEMAARFGCRPADLVAAVGPSVGACCYEVGGEVVAAYRAAGHDEARIGRWFTRNGHARYRLDLWQATRDQLETAGVLPEHIHLAGLCTASHPDWFFSYRVEGPASGRMLGVIRAGLEVTG
jgi:YfiH family protein